MELATACIMCGIFDIVAVAEFMNVTGMYHVHWIALFGVLSDVFHVHELVPCDLCGLGRITYRGDSMMDGHVPCASTC